METETAVTDAPVEQVVDTQPEQTDQAPPAPAAVDISTVDVSTLAPELQELAKSFQADYTKKTQELSSVKNKAVAFDELVSNPEFASAFENFQKTGSFVAQQPTTVEEKPLAEMSGEEQLLKILEDPQWLTNKIREEAKTLTQPLSEIEYARQADSTFQQLSTKYPDFAELGDQIAAKMEASGYQMDAEDAYKAVAYDKSFQKGINEGAKAVQDRVGAASTKGSPASVVSNKAAKTIYEAFQAAKKTHNMA